MKKSIQSLVAVAALALTALTAHAQAAPKILVVDLAKLFDNHWKTQEQQAKLKADGAKAQDQVAQLQKDGNALVEEFKELDEQSKNPTATAEAKAKAQADAQKKYDEIQQKRTELQSFAHWKLEGFTNEEIASRLGCVERTVERKLQRIRLLWAKELPS